MPGRAFQLNCKLYNFFYIAKQYTLIICSETVAMGVRVHKRVYRVQ